MTKQRGIDWLPEGIHPDVSAEDYHCGPTKEPSLSAHIAHQLLAYSPRHAWAHHPQLNPAFERVEREVFDLGTVAHALLLQGLEIAEVVDFDDWRKQDARDLRDQARKDGKIPLLSKHWDRCQQMVKAVREQLDNLDVEIPLFRDGLPEQTLVWTENGAVCRARLDWLHTGYAAIDDLKTSTGTANPKVWARRALWAIGADIQQVMYQRAVRALTGVEPEFRFVIAESQPPYAISVLTLDPSALAIANANLDRAIAKWKYCLVADDWPAYPQEVVSIEAPAWAEGELWALEAEEATAA